MAMAATRVACARARRSLSVDADAPAQMFRSQFISSSERGFDPRLWFTRACGPATMVDRPVLLWHRFFNRMVRLADSNSARRRRTAADEEDVAISAFHSLCEGVVRGNFPQLHDRDEFWRLLTTITVRKALDVIERPLGGRSEADRGQRGWSERLGPARLPAAVSKAWSTWRPGYRHSRRGISEAL